MAKSSNKVGRGGSPNSRAALERSRQKKGQPARSRTHGLGAVKPENLPPEVETLRAALAEQAPVRAADGSLPQADGPMIEVTARVMAKVRYGNAWLDQHGWFGEDGVLRPVVSELAKFERQLVEHLDRLGMTPVARMKLGLDLARTVDLATAMAEPDDAKRTELLRQAGVGVVEGTAEEVSGA